MQSYKVLAHLGTWLHVSKEQFESPHWLLSTTEAARLMSLSGFFCFPLFTSVPNTPDAKPYFLLHWEAELQYTYVESPSHVKWPKAKAVWYGFLNQVLGWKKLETNILSGIYYLTGLYMGKLSIL